ncbi:MAG: glycoside hydrolase family 13 protein [Pseudoxanthomonas sp.]
MRLAFAFFCWLLLAVPSARAADIERVEPANWWVGMRHHRVELMVHGQAIAGLTPRMTHAGVRIVEVQGTGNPNYLFVTVDIDERAKPGEFDLELLDGARVAARHPWRLDARAPGSAQRRGFDAADAIYLVMPDRFADGDAGNDSVPGYADRADRGQPSGRHGGDIAGLRAHLDYLAGMGFTQLWSTPLLENAQPGESYHGYAITDLYRIDPRFGSNADYRALVREARARGLGVIMDVVLNHVGSSHWWMADPPAPDWFNSPGRYVETNHRRTTVQDPHAAPADAARFKDGWFVRTMPDLNQRNPHLATYLIQNTLWWIEYAGLSGIREDTYSYADTAFLGAWGRAVLEEYPNFSMVGEEWSANPAIVAHWQRGKVNPDGFVPSMPSMMDFPLMIALGKVLAAPGDDEALTGLYETLADDFLYPDPDRLVVFSENHDTSRLLAQLDGDAARWRLAMAYLATVRGTPQFYYGSEVLLRGPKQRDDGLSRMDMPGGWRGDAVDAFGGRGLSEEQRAAQQWLRTLLQWRRATAVVHAGALTHFAPENGVYVYFRHDGTHTVMVALNTRDAPATLALDRFAPFVPAGSRWRSPFDAGPTTLGGTLALPPLSATILQRL